MSSEVHSPAGPQLSSVGKHFVLICFAALSVVPVLLIVMNSLKERRAIFADPTALPGLKTFSLVGYKTVFARSDIVLYYYNSMTITLVSLVLILILASMIAFALAEYQFVGNKLLAVYFLLGIIIPVRLGSVSMLQLIVSLKLVNTLTALILVYTAMGMPLAVFVLTQFMRQVPGEIKDAARIDGASEYRVFLLVLPTLRPAIATVAILTIIPIWNDLWFPLILAPAPETRTVTLGASSFLGQFSSDWNAVLAALTLSAVPIMTLYLIFSKQLLGGLTAGAVR